MKAVKVYERLQKAMKTIQSLGLSGLKQSMKPMIRKSIDQSMTIDALLVNWHRPIDDQSIITQKLSNSSIVIDWR